MPAQSGRARLFRNLLLTATAVFLLLRFVHLTADYPGNIRWDDGIATDEGWYASSAVNAQTWGQALLPGDMNIPVLMPVWPAIASLAFKLGGFHVGTLRATAVLFFILCLALGCVLLRRYGAKEWVPLFAALLAINPWAFAFSRAGFLEFPTVALCLLAMVAGVDRRPEQERLSSTLRLTRLLVGGVIFALAVLLKSIAVVLAPVVLYMVLEAHRFRVRRAVRDAVLFFGAAGLVYAPYWWLRIRPHQTDVNFYLSVVKNTLRLTPYGLIADTSRPFRYGLGSDHILFALSLVVLPVSLLSRRARVLWRDPLFALAGVWLISFLGFMVKHNNDPARYFAVTLPAVLMLTMAMLRNVSWSGPRARGVLLALVAADLCINAAQITIAMLHPAYTFHNASMAIGQIVRSDPAHSQVVIGDDMHEVALGSGLRPVNLLFHSASITEQMERYQPGWWLQFSPIEDGRCFRQVLSKAYTAEKRGEWTIFPNKQHLVLWKLDRVGRTDDPDTARP